MEWLSQSHVSVPNPEKTSTHFWIDTKTWKYTIERWDLQTWYSLHYWKSPSEDDFNRAQNQHQTLCIEPAKSFEYGLLCMLLRASSRPESREYNVDDKLDWGLCPLSLLIFYPTKIMKTILQRSWKQSLRCCLVQLKTLTEVREGNSTQMIQ